MTTVLKNKCLFHLLFCFQSCTYQQKTNITGVIVQGKQTYHYIDVLQFPHDTNLTLTCLLDAIKRHAPLPPTLYVQMDNCARENKNAYVMGFFAYMVKMGYVKHVRRSLYYI